VIFVVAAVGWAVKLPLHENVPPLKVIVICEPLLAGLRLAFTHERVTPEARFMLCTLAVVVIVLVMSPDMVKFPLIVSVDAAELPYVSEAIVAGVVIVGWLVIAPVPIRTASSDPGGRLGVPLTVVQFEAVSHAVLVAPVQRTVPAESASASSTRTRARIKSVKVINFFMYVRSYPQLLDVSKNPLTEAINQERTRVSVEDTSRI
jgi:hypothetical protein